MKQFKNVLKFEYMGYLRSKGFIASTIVLMVLVIAALFIPAIVGAFRSDTSESYGYGQEVVTDVELVPAIIIDYSGFFTEEVLNRHLPGHVWSHGYSEAVAAALVEEGDYYRMALIIAEDGMSFRGYERVAIVFGAGSSQQIRNMIDYVIRRDTLASYGLSSEAIDGYMNLFPFGAPQGWLQNVGADGTNFAFGYVMLFLMFFVVIMYAQFISTSVVVEKSSKAMEVLITSARPLQLMTGKVFGVGLAGITQYVLVLGTAFIGYTLTASSWLEFSPEVAAILGGNLSFGFLMLTLLFFFLSFFGFAFILAGFACTISKVEEVGTVTTIPMLLFGGAFYLAITGSVMPDAGWVQVVSFIPFVSPLVMYSRIAVAMPEAWEIVLATIINITAIMFMAWLSSRIYRVGVMLYGNKPKFKDVIRYMFAKN